MNFQTRSFTAKLVTIKENGDADIKVSIIVEVVGNPYTTDDAFTSGALKDFTIVGWATKTGQQQLDSLTTSVHNWVSSTYPNV